jgi:ABC-type dipeptide/oligopeptide/nickel transport system ATPase subunit
MGRTFEDRPAVREATPLLLGLVGPSGSGKTYSALRLATGIQKVSGGDIYGIDTESRRMLHYADRFKFRHVPFGSPFSPLDYLAAIEHCVAKGAKVIIVDSMSHEHEGPGGVLEEHQAETKRISKAWGVSESKAQLAAWGEPKKKRRRMINSILQMPVNFIFCFRAKEKLRIVKGEDPLPLGYMPIAGEEFVFEMVLKCLLLPGANGTPTWSSDFPGERSMIKLPEQFKMMFRQPTQLTEESGEGLAKWAAGTDGAKKSEDVAELLVRYQACSDAATYRVLEDERRAVWASTSKDDKARLKAAADEATKRIDDATAAASSDPSGASEDRADIE